MPCLAVLSVLSAASSPCPDLNLIHYNIKGRLKTDCQAFRRPLPSFYASFFKHIFNNAHHAAGNGVGHLAVDLAADGIGDVVTQALS